MSDQWVMEIGGFAPEWVQRAVADERLVPVQQPPQINTWASEGMRIVKTGRVVMPHETITREEIGG